MQSPSEEAVLSRLHSWNCEWLARPNIALSELAMTIKDNMPLLRQYAGTVFTHEFIEDLLSSFDPLVPAMVRVDNKDKSDQAAPTRENVVGLLKNLDQKEELQEAVIDGFNAAGPLLMVATQVMAIQTLIRNPQDFAEKLSRDTQHQQFRDDPTPRGMCNYILDAVTKKRRPVHRHISVWDEDDEEEQDPQPRGSRSRRRGQPMPQMPKPSCSWEEDNPRRKRSSAKPKKRTHTQPEKRARPSKVRKVSSSSSSSEEEVTKVLGKAKQKLPPRKTSTPKSFSSSSSGSSSDDEPKRSVAKSAASAAPSKPGKGKAALAKSTAPSKTGAEKNYRPARKRQFKGQDCTQKSKAP